MRAAGVAAVAVVLGAWAVVSARHWSRVMGYRRPSRIGR